MLEFLGQKEKSFIFSVLKEFSKKACNLNIRGIEKIHQDKEFGQTYSEIQFKPENWDERYFICLGFEAELCALFYGIKDASDAASEPKENPLILELQHVLVKGDVPNNRWLYSDWILEGEDYEKLVDITENGFLIELIQQKVKEILDKTSALSMK